ncbi:hypothetical protein AWC03_18000 [Mycobacterium europaeum]|uniref:helix-turn-helix domain-containing protein n=1 Tax=Mycobacterium europaeum TaxID=761804 RepID=UPI000A2331FE|nr:LysR family transcriptional regulator [Mycobacterium europaeum]ORV54780.1 hypothetical protein AWC03_18000 [Mycobacterium europaeum]
MEISQMRAFVAVVEYGGFSAAARRLHISQPALSGKIQALEKHPGVPVVPDLVEQFDKLLVGCRVS